MKVDFDIGEGFHYQFFIMIFRFFIILEAMEKQPVTSGTLSPAATCRSNDDRASRSPVRDRQSLINLAISIINMDGTSVRCGLQANSFIPRSDFFFHSFNINCFLLPPAPSSHVNV